MDDLTGYQREMARLRVAHLLETETGFRGGDPRHPDHGEPRPAYDLQNTTLGQRRRAKVSELGELGVDEAALLRLGRVSERTLKRMAAAWRDSGPIGCADGRWLRAGGNHPSITEEIREAIFAVRAESLHRSKMSMQARCVQINQYLTEKFGPHVHVPCYWTLRAVWLEWFGPSGTRQRYVRSSTTWTESGTGSSELAWFSARAFHDRVRANSPQDSPDLRRAGARPAFFKIAHDPSS